MAKNKFDTSKLDKSKQFRTNLNRDDILDAEFVQKHPDFVIDCNGFHYFISKLGFLFDHDKILNILREIATETQTKDRFDLIVSRKAHKDIVIKILFRGGKLDDIHRAMILL